MASKRIALVTGANGYIAGQTIAAFLAAGYAVRGTVRSKPSAKPLVDAFSKYGKDLEIVEVPDIVAPGAFDEAVKGVHAIAHLASPVGFSFTDPDPIIEAAVQGTVGILGSAIKETSIKSVVLMSSIAAIVSFTSTDTSPHVFTEEDWNLGSLDQIKEEGKNAGGALIYVASKTAGEQAFWKFRDEQKPTFTMTAVNPVFVMGPHAVLDSVDKVSQTTAWIWSVFSGQQIPAPIVPVPFFVDVRDVARVVVFGVQHPEKANNERFLLSRGVIPPQAAADILRKAYPDRKDLIKVGTPGAGYLADFTVPGDRTIDGSKAVRVTGQDYISVEQSITDAAKSLEKFL
ncbi:hypothetical protein G7046_g7155 [Stylonectria norvegica]|nr:hypothetical protein G7046_g7155 [Stylonectria norvegica]